MKDKFTKKYLEKESKRQRKTLNLIASENVTYPEVLKALGSSLTDKYSEGQPGNRYYTGNVNIDAIELECKRRALALYNLDSKWDVNVQAHSGSIANLAVYNALLQPGDKLMGMGLSSGGHLSHGFFTDKRKVTMSSTVYSSQQYNVDTNGYLDLDKLSRSVQLWFKPKLLIVGGSSYPRDFNFKRLRKIADSVDAYLMYDMSHTCGLVASGCLVNPFEHCDIVTTTTHKSLRGPRGALIFFRKGLKRKIDSSVFPGIQGGPHNNNIAGIGVALYYANTPEYVKYCMEIQRFSKILCSLLRKKHIGISTDGTDNGIILIKLPESCDSQKIVEEFESIGITLNKNSIPGDISAVKPSGIRIGLACLLSRGLKHKHLDTIADILEGVINSDYNKQEYIKKVRSVVKKLK